MAEEISQEEKAVREDLIAVLKKHYGIEAADSDIQTLEGGHINYTFRVGNKVFQRINTTVFKKPGELMENFTGVTTYMKQKVEDKGGDPKRECIYVIPTTGGSSYCVSDKGNSWRADNYLGGTREPNPRDLEDIYRVGRGFGKLVSLLDGYPVEGLHETIPHFHDTPKRFHAFKHYIDRDLSRRRIGHKERATAEGKEDSYLNQLIRFYISQEEYCSFITREVEAGRIPQRVTHNDTKFKNVLFDTEDDSIEIPIDYDTVMLGTVLADYGDMIRSLCNPADEEPEDIRDVHLWLESFEAVTRGWLDGTEGKLKPEEILNLHRAPRTLTVECGIRFLGDYINGDTYFKVKNPDDNLLRARSQMRLACDMERKEEQMKEIIQRLALERGFITQEDIDKYEEQQTQSTAQKNKRSSLVPDEDLLGG